MQGSNAAAWSHSEFLSVSSLDEKRFAVLIIVIRYLQILYLSFNTVDLCTHWSVWATEAFRARKRPICLVTLGVEILVCAVHAEQTFLRSP